MSVTLLRHAALEAITIEHATGIDGQGRPAYAAGVTVQARVVRKGSVVMLANGDEVHVSITIWIPANQADFPNEDDRVTCLDGFVGIVTDRSDTKTLQNVLDHVRVHLRRE